MGRLRDLGQRDLQSANMYIMYTYMYNSDDSSLNKIDAFAAVAKSSNNKQEI